MQFVSNDVNRDDKIVLYLIKQYSNNDYLYHK